MTFAPPKPITIEPAKEYVAGGRSPYGGYLTAARALPLPFDDLSRTLTAEIYDRMEYDAHIKAVTTIFRANIVGDGLETVSELDDDKADGFEMAKQLTTECSEMMDDLDSSQNELWFQYTRAMNVGHVDGELVWEQRAGKLVLKDIKIKPRHALAYVVDPFMNTLGLLAILPGVANTLQTGNYLVGAPGEKIPNLLPREKFACFPWHPEFNDPRGTSVLRSVYVPWWQKVQLEAEYLKYLTQFASPSIVGTLAEDAQSVGLVDATGAPLLDTNGNQQVLTAAQAMEQSIITLRNGTYIVIPFGATVKPLITTGDGRAFDIAFHGYNRDIVLGILTQTLATGEGEHASRAQAGVHQDALQTIVKQGKQGLCAMIRRDIYRQYVLYNYGEKYLPLTPKASLGDAAETDYAPLWTALAALDSSGFLDVSQKRPLDVQVGLPQRSAESVDLAAQMQQAAAKLALNPPPIAANVGDPVKPAPPAGKPAAAAA